MKCDVDCNILPTPNIRLFHTREKLARFLDRFGIPCEPDKFADAETWTFDFDGEAYAAVLYESDIKRSCVDDVSLLAHEAVHVALYTFGCIGESEPAEEEMCYMVQCILHSLVGKHFAWKERRLSKG